MLVSKNIVEEWYNTSHWMYRQFAYLFQNKLWVKPIPRGFSVCPYFWTALFSFLIFRPMVFVFGPLFKLLARVFSWPVIFSAFIASVFFLISYIVMCETLTLYFLENYMVFAFLSSIYISAITDLFGLIRTIYGPHNKTFPTFTVSALLINALIGVLLNIKDIGEFIVRAVKYITNLILTFLNWIPFDNFPLSLWMYVALVICFHGIAIYGLDLYYQYVDNKPKKHLDTIDEARRVQYVEDAWISMLHNLFEGNISLGRSIYYQLRRVISKEQRETADHFSDKSINIYTTPFGYIIKEIIYDWILSNLKPYYSKMAKQFIPPERKMNPNDHRYNNPEYLLEDIFYNDTIPDNIDIIPEYIINKYKMEFCSLLDKKKSHVKISNTLIEILDGFYEKILSILDTIVKNVKIFFKYILILIKARKEKACPFFYFNDNKTQINK